MVYHWLRVHSCNRLFGSLHILIWRKCMDSMLNLLRIRSMLVHWLQETATMDLSPMLWYWGDWVANGGVFSNWKGQQSSHIVHMIMIAYYMYLWLHMYIIVHIQKGNQSNLSRFWDNGLHEPYLLFRPCLSQDSRLLVLLIFPVWNGSFCGKPYRGYSTSQELEREREMLLICSSFEFSNDEGREMCVCRAHCLKTIHSIWVIHWLHISRLFRFKGLASPSTRKSHGKTFKTVSSTAFRLSDSIKKHGKTTIWFAAQ